MVGKAGTGWKLADKDGGRDTDSMRSDGSKVLRVEVYDARDEIYIPID